MSRPLGSKNKPKEEIHVAINEEVKKRGRPKGSINIDVPISQKETNPLCLKCKKECKQLAIITIIDCHFKPFDIAE